MNLYRPYRKIYTEAILFREFKIGAVEGTFACAGILMHRKVRLKISMLAKGKSGSI